MTCLLHVVSWRPYPPAEENILPAGRYGSQFLCKQFGGGIRKISTIPFHQECSNLFSCGVLQRPNFVTGSGPNPKRNPDFSRIVMVFWTVFILSASPSFLTKPWLFQITAVIQYEFKGTNPALKKPSNIPEIYAKMFGRFHWSRL